MTAWKVTDQQTMPGGGNVTYQTDDGQEHTIFIGTPDYNPKRVAQLINAEVAARDAIAQLSSDEGTTT